VRGTVYFDGYGIAGLLWALAAWAIAGTAALALVATWRRRTTPGAGGARTVTEGRHAAPPASGPGPPRVTCSARSRVDAPPATVWPWLVQLGKQRAGWYLPHAVERFLPRSRRAARSLNPAWLGLETGDIIPDYGGRHETFEVAQITPPAALVYRSRRGHTNLTWSLTLEPVGGQLASDEPARTRVFLRLRMTPVRHQRLARAAGELIDLLTVAGMAAGLAERLRRRARP
jgi:hypothetical protein